MNKYVALFFGYGDSWGKNAREYARIFESKNVVEAVKHCKHEWNEFGCSEVIEKIKLFSIDKSVPVPVDLWNETDREEMENKEDMEKLREAEKCVAMLRKKINKSKKL